MRDIIRDYITVAIGLAAIAAAATTYWVLSFVEQHRR